jgi:hypothetical protein
MMKLRMLDENQKKKIIDTYVRNPFTRYPINLSAGFGKCGVVGGV